MPASEVRAWCELAYRKYHHRRFLSPDPLELVVGYPDARDREVAGLIASALATGRVGGIVRAGRWVLDRLPSPNSSLAAMSEGELRSACAPFVYRFFDGRQLGALLIATKRVIRDYGSLESCLAAGISEPTKQDGRSGAPLEPVVAGISHLSRSLHSASDGKLAGSILVADPDRGSACKRMLLFLRWMVRCDDIDPGGWTALSPSQLLVPVDTHMLSVCRSLGLTTARQPSLRVAREITGAFRTMAPDDPVRYDFSLTRLGIHPDVRDTDLSRNIRSSGAEFSGSA